jgi:anti-sigma factor RsiW
MSMISCLWMRPRLEGYADSGLDQRLMRAVEAHLARCPHCLAGVERHIRQRNVVKAALPVPPEPDWTGFWPGIQARIAVKDTPKPLKDWLKNWGWAPVWTPVWGHPRVALGGVMAVVMALFLSLWPGGESQVSTAWAGPVVVQDVGTPDPERTVMVYSTPDQDLTVIWLFNSGDATEES